MRKQRKQTQVLNRLGQEEEGTVDNEVQNLFIETELLVMACILSSAAGHQPGH
ncbi:hypothetical protein [Paraflavitalea speifideaquila]|uniref:hypothetical protein n=1 Tax=Paraflavitalea speifideaquila TaxID=3076558 RepID=UPI0028ED8850|nr:hypothetical protein [Paraflavitalea speifideiaquila]